MRPTQAPSTSLCIVRSEPLDGSWLYSVRTVTDVSQTADVREQHTSDIAEVLRIVQAFLCETKLRQAPGGHPAM